jgi:predicted nucleic acid-binding protein
MGRQPTIAAAAPACPQIYLGYVLDETITLLFRRLPFRTARGSLAKIEEAIKGGFLRVEWITPERFEQAKALRFKYQDKPKISFTDLTSDRDQLGKISWMVFIESEQVK